ncbi:MAG: YbjN domain-containing protein [Oscillospiraceae bacterium]|nr:YbjN domain-containing protein [Oscillospiraceae bacterium]
MEVTAERAALTKKNAEILISMLEHRKLRYAVEEQSDARTHIRISFTGNDLPMTLHIILRADRQIVSVLSAMPFKMAPERMHDAAVAVIAANHGLIDGSFDLNMQTGEIFFRLTTAYLGTTLTEELFSYLMFVSAETIDRFNDRFNDLNDGKLDLPGFLEADAADERPRNETGV